jgi:hypothetical protein
MALFWRENQSVHTEKRKRKRKKKRVSKRAHDLETQDVS